MKSNIKIGTIIGVFFAVVVLLLLIILNVSKDQSSDESNATEPSAQMQAEDSGSRESETDSITANSTEDEDPAYFERYDYYGGKKDGFSNCGTVSCTIQYEGKDYVYTFGVDSKQNRSLYMNPHCEQATVDFPIGFYFQDDDALFYTPIDPNMNRQQLTEEKATNYYIEWTYDTMWNAEYYSPREFGVEWLPANDELDEHMIRVRAIDFNTSQMIAIIHIDVKKDAEGNYYLASAYDGQVTDPELCELLANKARERIGKIDGLMMGPQCYTDTPVLIERLERQTYFYKFCEITGNTMRYSANAGYPIYAVTVGTTNSAFGYFTFYLRPMMNAYGEETRSFVPEGYDALLPFDKDVLRVFD